ncbi:MAG TPA: hypothetical protein VIX80_04980 [Candidatus Kapabacteria bacterium]
MTLSHTKPHPRVLVLGGNKLPWKASDRPHEAATMTGIESWVYAFGGDYLCGMDATPAIVSKYDIVIGNTNLTFIPHLITLAESRGHETKWVSLIEGSGTDYLRPIPGVPKIFDVSDLVISINKYTTDLFRAMTTTRVEYIGIPFPAETIRKLSTPIDKRLKEIYLSPFLLNRWSEVFVARQAKIPYYGIERRLTRKVKTLLPNLKKYRTVDPKYFMDKAKRLYNEPMLSIRRESSLEEHFRNEGSAMLWLNFDERYTWGRNVLDAAALGIPIISTRSTGHQEDFFPLLLLETPFELEKALALTLRLTNDQEFYREVSTIPLERFAHLRPEYMSAKLLDVLYS